MSVSVLLHRVALVEQERVQSRVSKTHEARSCSITLPGCCRHESNLLIDLDARNSDFLGPHNSAEILTIAVFNGESFSSNGGKRA
jgi:hypothetical protein